MASHQDSRPTNALLAKAVELCEAKGVSCLIYGQFNYGNKRDNPLREFKIRCGFTEFSCRGISFPYVVGRNLRENETA